MFKGSNNVALGYDEGSILIKVCQLHDFVQLFQETLWEKKRTTAHVEYQT